jgi:hypothetical protein
MENQVVGNRPQLKKIKRPIARSPLQTAAQAGDSQNLTMPFRQEVQPIKTIPAQSEVDRYMDDDSDLPVVKTGQLIKEPVKETPQYLDEDEYEEEVYGHRPLNNEAPSWLTSKVLVLVSLVCLFVGVVCGKVFLAESKVVRNGLQGVIVNNEVPRGRARCGVAERTQGCVLYLMNPQKQDMYAKDFYDLAAQMTGRQRFMIETGNMRYANSRIKPGEIAQLNIPPL